MKLSELCDYLEFLETIVITNDHGDLYFTYKGKNLPVTALFASSTEIQSAIAKTKTLIRTLAK